MNIFDTVFQMKMYLISKNVKFNSDGFPIFKTNWFGKDKPKSILPYNHRKSLFGISKKDTIICFYCNDESLYTRLSRFKDDVIELQDFLGVVSMDISVCKQMNPKLQRFNMFLSSLYTASLAVNKIKIYPSIRCGNERTIKYLYNYKDAPIFIIGTLGTKRSKTVVYDKYILLLTIRMLNIKHLISYGKPSDEDLELFIQNLDTFDYILDFRTVSFSRRDYH